MQSLQLRMSSCVGCVGGVVQLVLLCWQSSMKEKEGAVLCQWMVHSPSSSVDDGCGCADGGDQPLFSNKMIIACLC